jgi:hypothetical protein
MRTFTWILLSLAWILTGLPVCSNEMPKKVYEDVQANNMMAFQTTEEANWSKPLNGLKGRLLVSFEDLRPGLRHAVVLEFKNVSMDAIAVSNQPDVINAVLVDSKGKALHQSSFSMSGPVPCEQDAIIPRDAYVGFRIDAQTVGCPSEGTALLALANKQSLPKQWNLHPGQYTLRTAISLSGRSGKNVPLNGVMNLPAVTIIVSAAAVTEKHR